MTLDDTTRGAIIFYESQMSDADLREVKLTALDRTPVENMEVGWADALYDNMVYYLIQSYRAKLYRERYI